MMAERGIELTHTTILRWVQRFVPKNSRSAGVSTRGQWVGHGVVMKPILR
jgi:transposase-like protein